MSAAAATIVQYRIHELPISIARKTKMKKQTNLHPIKLLSLAICAAIIIGTSFSVSAQQPKPVLKDRLVKVLQDKSLSKEQITSIIKKTGLILN